jgi:hypothetical protein
LIVWGDSPAAFVRSVFGAFAADLAFDGLGLYASNQAGNLERVAIEGLLVDPTGGEYRRAVQVFTSALDAESAGDYGRSEPEFNYRSENENNLSTAEGRDRSHFFVPILVDDRPVGVLEIMRNPSAPELTSW